MKNGEMIQIFLMMAIMGVMSTALLRSAKLNVLYKLTECNGKSCVERINIYKWKGTSFYSNNILYALHETALCIVDQ